MKLPTPNLITYETVLPSNGKKIKFRPYVMAEEKILMMAYEEPEATRKEVVLNALRQVLAAVIQTPDVDLSVMSAFDLEWLMTQVRIHSVGRVVEVSLRHIPDPANPRPCDTCKEQTKVFIDLGKAIIKRDPEEQKVFDFGGGYGISMTYPTSELLDRISDNLQGPKMIEVLIEITAACVDTIFSADNVWEAGDLTHEEIKNWLMHFPMVNLDKIIENFFLKMPHFALDVQWTCEKCGQSETLNIRGMMDFFL